MLIYWNAYLGKRIFCSTKNIFQFPIVDSVRPIAIHSLGSQRILNNKITISSTQKKIIVKH